MDMVDKLKVLSDDSRYDLACACGTQKDEHRRRGLDGRWLYPVALPQGGYTVLLKTLLSNACANDCGYCPLRTDTDVPRCTLRPEEVARVFMEYLRRKSVSGLFLSSAVMGNADYTMERINATARIIRRKHGFRGYIHLKIIPGASDAALEEALSLASAVSLNIETPSKQSFDQLSLRKDYENDIIRPMALLGRLTGRGMKYSRVKCTTQYIVGASDETDSQIVDSMYGLYERMNFKRVYFSAYQKGLGHPDIPAASTALNAMRYPSTPTATSGSTATPRRSGRSCTRNFSRCGSTRRTGRPCSGCRGSGRRRRRRCSGTGESATWPGSKMSASKERGPKRCNAT
jgi:predicted DNA-binding helix-hairpin-helix protein